MDYQTFLATKKHIVGSVGKDVSTGDFHGKLFGWQKDVGRWAAKKGRGAIFLDTGLGKTYQQLEWARLLGENTVIVAPLSVARQTVRMAHDIDSEVRYVRSQAEVSGGHKLWITNYEMIDNFDPAKFGAVVLDESSIIKGMGSKTRVKLLSMFKDTQYRLCCTATPAPNDYIELGNHAEFLGVCKMSEMLATFFINANKEHTKHFGDVTYTQKGSNTNGTEWRLKHHAEKHFFEWLASWAITMTKPSDLGYDDDGFILPPLNITPTYVRGDYKPSDQLFFTHLHGISDRAKVRNETLGSKVLDCLKLVLRDLNVGGDGICQEIQKNTIKSITQSIGIESLKESGINASLSQKKNERPDCCITESGIEIIEQKNEINRESINNRSHQSNSCDVKPSVMNITCGTKNTLSSDPKNGIGITHDELKLDGSKNTVLHMTNGSASSDCKMGDVQSAGCLEKIPETDYMLTTTTLAARLEDYYAKIATWELGNLRIALKSWLKQQNISRGLLKKWVIWCGLDREQDLLADIFGDLCVSVYGSLSPDEKERREESWREGDIPIMITKTKVFGYGMNWQCSHNMIFFGLNDSFESFYQAIRREWRYGQPNPVNIYPIMHEVEAEVYANVMRKEAAATRLKKSLIEQIKDYEKGELGLNVNISSDYAKDTQTGRNWTAMLGDSCERLKEIPDNSIDLSVYSPPFADLFTYTATERDLGNSRDWGEFFEHYAFIIREILRVTKPGRLTCVHTSDIPAMAQKDGYIGLRDFPGEVIRAYEREGWVFRGRAFIQKNPQAQAIRIHSKALAFGQLRKDSSDIRPALIDQVLLMKKSGDNAVPITPVANGEMDNETWIEWANGIWVGIRETDTLQYAKARGVEDEKHICPLALGTIERCIKLYSNPNETVLTPFGGIGSEAYQALRFGRKAVLIELKPEYYAVAVKNLREAEESKQDMFSQSGMAV